MINEKVNIFEFATKELSQDAVLLYLADCFNAPEKRYIGERFLSSFFGEEILNGLVRVVPIKQYKNIDVLLRLEYDGCYTLCVIEDKVNSGEHDNQLQRYMEKLDNDISNLPGNNALKPKDRKFTYFKPIFFNKREKNRIENIGYRVKTVKDIMSVLNGITDDNVCISFREYLDANYSAITEAADCLDDDSYTDEQINTLMLWREGHWKLFEYIIKKSGIPVEYRKFKEGTNRDGTNWTQYRIVFDYDVQPGNWWFSEEELAKEPHSEFSYFFRLDSKSTPTLTFKQYKWFEKGEKFDFAHKNEIRWQLTDILADEGINVKKRRNQHQESEVACWQFTTKKEIEDIARQLKIVYDKVIGFVTK